MLEQDGDGRKFEGIFSDGREDCGPESNLRRDEMGRHAECDLRIYL